MEYLKKFDTASDYEAYIIGNPSLPNVSLVGGNNVKYNKTRPEQNQS